MEGCLLAIRQLHTAGWSHNDFRNTNFGLNAEGTWALFDGDRSELLGEVMAQGGTHFSTVTFALVGETAKTSHGMRCLTARAGWLSHCYCWLADVISLGLILLRILLAGTGPEYGKCPVSQRANMPTCQRLTSICSQGEADPELRS